MNRIRTYFVCLSIVSTSCTVLNHTYVNDPVPLGKNNAELFVGGGTGLKSHVDSITDDGTLKFSDQMERAPHLFIASQIGLGDKTDLRMAAHLPYVVGGFGLRGGLQYSFLPTPSKFHAAGGFDVGFVVAKDSIHLLGFHEELNIYGNGGLNSDVFLSFSYSFNEHTKIIISPRMSYNALFLRYNKYKRQTRIYAPLLPSLSMALKIHKVYLEANVIYFEGSYLPNFALSYCAPLNMVKDE